MHLGAEVDKACIDQTLICRLHVRVQNEMVNTICWGEYKIPKA